MAQQVDSLIAETFTLTLTPSQQPGTSEISWHTTKATTKGDIGARVSKKLATEEKLIAQYGGVRVKMDIDRYDLWSDRRDISVSDLWSTYARYPHMPRLASFQVLKGAIGDGTANLNWQHETFGYAEAHDGDKGVGVQVTQHVTPQMGGLLVHPEHVPIKKDEEAEDDGGSGAAASADGGEEKTSPPKSGGPTKSQFYAQFELDPVRGIKELGEILEHVTARLGANVELHLEVRAEDAEGFDDATQRIVTENATNLGATGAEFEA